MTTVYAVFVCAMGVFCGPPQGNPFNGGPGIYSSLDDCDRAMHWYEAHTPRGSVTVECRQRQVLPDWQPIGR